MFNQMNNLSRRMDSIETLQVKWSSESEHSSDNYRIPQRPVPRKNRNVTNIRVTMTLMTLMIVSIPMITVKDQLILGTVNTTAIKVITTTMTLMSES